MVPSHQNRYRPILERACYRVARELAPLCHLREVAVTVGRRLLRVAGTCQVAGIEDLVAEPAQGRLDAGDSQRVRTHGGAAFAGTDIRRRADQGNLQLAGVAHPAYCPCWRRKLIAVVPPRPDALHFRHE